MIEDKLLFVDDDPNLLKAYERQLRKVIRIQTAQGGQEGLDTIRDEGPFAVIVADLRMPGMDGIEFFRQVNKVSPESVRIMLTGHADTETALKAVNEGAIFRFLTKPCPPEVLGNSLLAGLEQYRLVTSEKRLLAETLNGAIKLLSEILAMADPEAFGRAMRLTEMVKVVAEVAGVEDPWELEVAATFSQIGYVTVPRELIDRASAGERLSPQEVEVLSRMPEVGEKLLASIPRLESVARAVRYQHKNFDGSGLPDDDVAGDDIPLGARVLKAVADFERLLAAGESKLSALGTMRKQQGRHDPRVLDVLFKIHGPTQGTMRSAATREFDANLAQIVHGDLLLGDVETVDGGLLLSAGVRISDAALARLRNYRDLNNLREPIRVMREVSPA